MNQIRLSLFLLLSFNIFCLKAMKIDPLNNIANNQRLIQLAEQCDLAALQKNVNEANVNTVDLMGYSLLTLSFKNCQSDNFTKVVDFLLSKGALADKQASEQESHYPLQVAVAGAILRGKFIPLKYLLQKGANPFLRSQAKKESSVAFIAVQNLDRKDNQGDNAKQVVQLFAARARSLDQALETFDIPTITQFASADTVNRASEDGLTPLLRVASICKCRENVAEKIFQILFSHGASVNQIGALHNKLKVPLQCITMHSIETGNTSLISLFLKQGADPKLNPEEEDHVHDNSSYGLAKFYKLENTACQNCGKQDCQAVLIDSSGEKNNNATKILELFDTWPKNE
jgi:hypothetical protein